MIVPFHFSRVEVCNFFASLYIYTPLLIGFKSIAMKTCKGEIVAVVSAANNNWNYMIHCKMNELKTFIRVAIFT